MSAISKLMQKITLSDPRIGKLFFTRMHPSFFEKKGLQTAIELFKNTVSSVPAYKKFLTQKNYHLDSPINFSNIPILDKESYIRAFAINDRITGGNLANAYAISMSSGLTGKATYWPRYKSSDDMIPKVMDLLLTDILDLPKKSALVLNTLSMGLWSAGDMATYGMRMLAARKNYRVTVATPGLRIDETLNLINEIGHHYDQIMLIGYPPFVKDIIDSGEKLDWKKMHIKIMMGGEGISEEFRDYLLAKIGSQNIFDVTNLFATSDASIVGFETPFSIIISKLIYSNPELSQKLLGQHSIVTLQQYNPMGKYLEEINGEIIITSGGAIPLIRYNIHDRGKIIHFSKIIAILESMHIDIAKEMKRYGFDFKNTFKLPLFAVFGRSDAEHFYAVNIYRENIMSGLKDRKLSQYISGKFRMGVIKDTNLQQKLQIEVELNKQIKPSDKINNLISETIHNELLKINSEYHELSKYLKEKNHREFRPDIILLPYKDPKFNYEIKHNYLIKK